ncbi:hypothetical protein B2J93_8160 [Marssonina coronariae]|uniref:Uncharacterized protein n=1 Tax=Diplocarpon coronariae TaxID=2795749 RepID=A0A218YSU1_9HELO|nr:hypothetical protein B2J93_8160 [Marssonina coronariae]
MQSPQLPPHRLRTAGILTDFPYVSTQTVWSTWVKGTIAVFVAAAPQKRQILLGPVPDPSRNRPRRRHLLNPRRGQADHRPRRDPRIPSNSTSQTPTLCFQYRETPGSRGIRRVSRGKWCWLTTTKSWVPDSPDLTPLCVPYQKYIDAYCALAIEPNIRTVPGILFEKHDDTLLNTASFVSNGGTILSSYQKKNL